MKKAEANMWWIIIGAVVALVAMVVLLVLLTGKTPIIQKEILSCEGKGGSCKYSAQDCIEEHQGRVSRAFECPDTEVKGIVAKEEEKVCCFLE